MPQDRLVEAAKEAIDEVFGDTTVSKEQTMERLEEIQSHLQANIDSLQEDIEREEDRG